MLLGNYFTNIDNSKKKIFFSGISFNSKDIKKDQGLIHKLMGNDVSLRKDYIFDNALNVENLDI